ncbi:hypothetical protein ACOBWM_001447 [Vibrio cholerae]
MVGFVKCVSFLKRRFKNNYTPFHLIAILAAQSEMYAEDLSASDVVMKE